MEEGLSDIVERLGWVSENLDAIRVAIEDNKPEPPSPPLGSEELEWQWIEDHGLIVLLKKVLIPTLDGYFKGPVKLKVVPGYTLPEDDHGIFYEAESTFFMVPKQWNLLKDTHVSELKWRFLTAAWKERAFYWVKSKWGEEDTFWVTLKNIDKQVMSSSNCIVLTFEVKIQVSTQFIHGPFVCRAAVQNLESQIRVEPLCVEAGMQCIQGHPRFACDLHREFAERTKCTLCEKK